ncbi:MAG: trypsin-like peptidase domain-containing protein [Salinivirgaceae bacterium]|nr:trypsin-like peptidase domain-containing protein [Salinivirgaceae bacterium]MDY0280496.1 trypsin-like peptidase domain-containing protein [Salinivirgaceae bacterium]
MKRNVFLQSLGMGFLGGVLVLVAYHFSIKSPVIDYNNNYNSLANQELPIHKTESVTMVQNHRYIDMTQAAQRSVDAVVHVKTMTVRSNQMQANPFFDFFFGEQGRSQQSVPMRATGSGVIISADGFIVTNNHVIEKADKIEVTLNDKRTFEAKVIGADPGTDIALLKIESDQLPFLTYGNSDSAMVGEWILAVGNPFNLTSTVTAGIISAKARNINIINKRYGIESFIQTDAAVNPGNSGGALVNSLGELIGINTAIASQTGTFTGYSFAVPISIVKKVVADLIEFGEVQRAVLGVVISDINTQLANEFGLKVLDGVLVQQTEEGGSAQNAGIVSGDVITQIGAVETKTVAELQDHLSRFRPGQEISLTVNRKGKLIETKTTLQNRLGSVSTIKKTDVDKLLGAVFEPINKRDAKTLSVNGGLQIIDIEKGKLLNAGIRKGFIITFVNGIAVQDVAQLRTALQKNKNGGVYVEGIYPNGMRAYYAFGL